MATARLLAVVLAIAAWANTATADFLRVIPAHDPIVEVSPREVLNLSYRLESSAAQAITVNPRLDLPNGWTLMVPPMPVVVPARGTAVLMLHLRVPARAAAGSQRIVVELRGRDGRLLAPELTTFVEVAVVSEVELELLAAPKWVVAGADARLKFAVANHSNVAVDLEVEVETRPRQPVETTSSSLHMEAGESAELGVSMATDVELSRADHQLITVRLFRGEEVVARISTRVQVVPQGTVGRPLFDSIPATLSVSLLNDQHNGGLTMQLAGHGSGTLGRSGEHYLAFDLVGPEDTIKASSLGRRDEYSLSYRGPRYAIDLGDQAYLLSPLTEIGRWGRGARVALSGEHWTVGGFTVKDQFVPFEEFAVFAELRPTAATGVSLNLLEKHDDERSRSRVASIETWYSADFLHAEAEFARNMSGDKDAGGYRLSASGAIGRLSFDANTLRTDADFAGPYQDRNADWLRSELRLGEAYSAWISYRNDRSRASQSLPTDTAPEQQEARLGLRRHFGQTQIALSTHHRTFVDRQLKPLFSTRRNSAGLALDLSRRLGSLHLSANMELGKLKDQLEQRSDNSHRVQIHASWYSSDTASVYASGSYQKNYHQLDNRELSLAAGGSVAFGSKFSLRSELRHVIGESGLDGDSRKQTFAQLGLQWQTARGHSLVLMGRRGAQNDRSAFLLEYTIPMQVPVRRRPDLGSIEGRVVERDSPVGVAKAVVTLAGLATVTDDEGNFRFRGLSVGEHMLQVDLGPRGVQWIALDTPRSLQVAAHDNNFVTVQLVRSATVRGRLERWQTPDGDLFAVGGTDNDHAAGGTPELVMTGGVGKVLVSLSNGSITLHRLTDTDGRFTFYGIPHGRWTVSVKANRLPPYTMIEQTRTTIDVDSGGETELTLRVVPKVRSIRMQNDGAAVDVDTS